MNEAVQAGAKVALNCKLQEQMERGVFDIEAVKQANRPLIDTIEESLTIADEGKARRVAAKDELWKMAQDLKQALAAAHPADGAA